MPHHQRLVEALENAREARALLEDLNLRKYPADVAAREHLIAAGSEIDLILQEGQPHVPRDVDRSLKQLAWDVHFLTLTLSDHLATCAPVINIVRENEDPMVAIREIDLDKLLREVGRIRQWSTGLEVEVRRLKQRLDEVDRRSN